MYLFTNSSYDKKRTLYCWVLVAAAQCAKAKAAEYGCSLTDRTVTFSIDDILEQMPVDTGTPEEPVFRPLFKVYQVIDAIQTLRAESYLDSEGSLDDFDALTLDDDLFTHIAAAWAESMGVVFRHGCLGYRCYASSRERALTITMNRYFREMAMLDKMREEVVAA